MKRVKKKKRKKKIKGGNEHLWCRNHTRKVPQFFFFYKSPKPTNLYITVFACFHVSLSTSSFQSEAGGTGVFLYGKEPARPSLTTTGWCVRFKPHSVVLWAVSTVAIESIWCSRRKTQWQRGIKGNKQRSYETNTQILQNNEFNKWERKTLINTLWPFSPNQNHRFLIKRTTLIKHTYGKS